MKMKFLYIGTISITIIGICAYFYAFYSPKPDIYSEKVEQKLSAKELFNKFEDNENQANKAFLGKVIEINGTLADVQKTQDNEIILILRDENQIFGVVCTMQEKKIDPDKIKIGTNLTIKGICKGYLTDVIVNNCVIIN